MAFSFELLLYFVLLSIGAFFTLRNWNCLTVSDRHIGILVLLTVISEITAEVLSAKIRNNMYVYHVYSPLEFVLISLYFNNRIEALKNRNIGILIALAGIIVAGLNTIFVQRPNSLNSNFLLFEALVIICLCVYSFYKIIKDEHEKTVTSVHFWVTSLLLFYWSFVFFFWGAYSIFTAEKPSFFYDLFYLLWFINILTYGGFALVFMKYKKLTSRVDE